MSGNCRVVCGITGAAWLLAVVLVNYCSNAQPFCGMCPFGTCPEPYSTVFGYLVSAASFYLIGEGVVGDRLRSRRLVVYLIIAALAVASVLVSGMHLYWALVPRGDWLD